MVTVLDEHREIGFASYELKSACSSEHFPVDFLVVRRTYIPRARRLSFVVVILFDW